MPLKVLDSPFRDITRPVLDYVNTCAEKAPGTSSSCSSPNTSSATGGNTCCTTSAPWPQSRLLFTPGVMVTNVPWPLASSALADKRPEPHAPGELRRTHPAEHQIPASPTPANPKP